MGWAAIAVWSFLCSCVIYGACKAAGILRLDLKSEIMGYDFVEFADDFDFGGRQLTPARQDSHYAHPTHSHE